MADDRNTRDRDTHITRETHVERDTGRRGSGMAFIVGGLAVAVLVIAYVLFGMGGSTDDSAGVSTENNVNVEAPDGGETAEGVDSAVEGAAESVGDAAEGAGDAVQGSQSPE